MITAIDIQRQIIESFDNAVSRNKAKQEEEREINAFGEVHLKVGEKYMSEDIKYLDENIAQAIERAIKEGKAKIKEEIIRTENMEISLIEYQNQVLVRSNNISLNQTKYSIYEEDPLLNKYDRNKNTKTGILISELA